MDSQDQKDILIIGAGPAGPSLAAFIGQNDTIRVQLLSRK
jgi:2-polyprenyl-6-methoxyphenol hydroxylase-like FAD-dependent oxidoreductase